MSGPTEQDPQRATLVYVAGPYRAPTRWSTECNIHRAEALGIAVAMLGAYPVIPHSNTRAYFEDLQGAEFFLGGTMELLRRCDAVILTEDWERSTGVLAERAEAERFGLPVFVNLAGLERWLHA